MKIKAIYLFFILIAFAINLTGVVASAEKMVNRIDPPHWYHQMQSDTLQLLLYGDGINQATIKILNEKAVLIYYQRSTSSDFLIIYLRLNRNLRSDLLFEIQDKKRKQTIQYSFFDLAMNPLRIEPSDVMYLLMPDRFSNGNLQNDEVIGMSEKINRQKPKGRHGGDIDGIMKHFNYIKSLNVSALWINPLLENNQPEESYHGYAATDLYKIDPRFGTNADYQRLSHQCLKDSIRLVMDVVYNHIGNEHPFYRKMISREWFHLFDSFTNSNYRGAAVVDPYASSFDKKKMSQGWFDRHMPDLNQQNADLARYLTQNTLWWIAYARLAGVRIDTYPYPDLEFMESLVRVIKLQFPDVFVFGETWEHGAPLQTFFAPNNATTSHQSNLDAVTDFQLYFAIQKAFNEPFGWTTGLASLYYTLTFDYLYRNPDKLVTFADNHDVDRILGVLNNDPAKFKMAMGFLLTTRGIPCVYYGTEIGMNDKGDHGLLRKDMPGGWSNDSSDVFDSNKRSKVQAEYFDFISNLNRYRTQHKKLFNEGRMTHFIPEKEVYAYFLYTEDEMMAVFLHQGNTETTLSCKRFEEMLKPGMKGTDVLDQKDLHWSNELILPPQSIRVLHFKLNK